MIDNREFIISQDNSKTYHKAKDLLDNLLINPQRKTAWLVLDLEESLTKLMNFWRNTIKSFCLANKQPKLFNEFQIKYRGVFFKNRLVIQFVGLNEPEKARGLIINPIKEIIFSDCVPADGKYLDNEPERFQHALDAVFQIESPKITFISNKWDPKGWMFGTRLLGENIKHYGEK